MCRDRVLLKDQAGDKKLEKQLEIARQKHLLPPIATRGLCSRWAPPAEAGPERLRVAPGPPRLVKAPIVTLRVQRLPCSTVPPEVLTPSPA